MVRCRKLDQPSESPTSSLDVPLPSLGSMQYKAIQKRARKWHQATRRKRPPHLRIASKNTNCFDG